MHAFTLLAVLVCASCTREHPEGGFSSESRSVSFDAYLYRGVATRTGDVGMLDGETLKDSGFGVFAYYTGNASFGPACTPDFMYNTMVSHAGSAWEYAPVKYWPNEDGSHDGEVDKVSFFAYAPYVAIDPVSGESAVADDGTPANSRETGIVRASLSTDAGTPSVAYVASFDPSRCVDLCWGSPLLDQVKPDSDSKLLFNFRHALSALNVQIDAVVDEMPAPGSIERDSDTRIYVRSVSFGGFSRAGTLSLGGTLTPQWSGFIPGTALDRDALTIHDGRLDGWEARYDDAGETVTGFNPDLVQQVSYNGKPGVTSTTVNLFASDIVTDPVYVIPNGYPFAIDVVYDVETRDDKIEDTFLADGQTHGTSTRVNVRTYVDTGSGAIRIEAGKRYYLRLHLGLTSVKFQAEIGISNQWSEDPHPIDFEAIIVGQPCTDYSVGDGNWTEWS